MSLSHHLTLIAVPVVCACITGMPGHALGGDKADPDARLNEMKRQRLDAARKAYESIKKELSWLKPGWEKGDAFGQVIQFVNCGDLLLRAQLDLCKSKEDKMKAYGDLIREFEPIVKIAEKRLKEQAKDAYPTFHFARAHLLELQIGLEKAKRGE